MSFKKFDFDDFNRLREIADVSRRVEEREKKKPTYLEKLSDERRTDLMKIYGPKPDKKATTSEKKVPPRTFFKKTTSLAFPRKSWPFRMERNQKKNIKIQDNKMAELRIDPNKRPKIERVNYVKDSDHKKYEKFKMTEYLYIPSRDLPYGGWIQHCVFCGYETTSLEKIDSYKLYCCNKCQKQHNMYEKRELCSEILHYIARLGY